VYARFIPNHIIQPPVLICKIHIHTFILTQQEQSGRNENYRLIIVHVKDEESGMRLHKKRRANNVL
jgi:hypothetical protein